MIELTAQQIEEVQKLWEREMKEALAYEEAEYIARQVFSLLVLLHES